MAKDLRKCSICELEHPLDTFTKNKSDPKGRNYECFECRNTKEYKNEKKVKRKIYYENNKQVVLTKHRTPEFKERRRELEKIRYNKNKKKASESNRKKLLKREYDITTEDYCNLLIEQEYRCKICSKHNDELRLSLFVDHDHNTGLVRGLLCSTCNSGLGMFKDNPEIILKAYNYLIKTKLINNKNSNKNEQKIKYA
jgi:hypothetical protein